MHDGIQVAPHTATIEPASIERDSLNCIISGLSVDGICELDFATSTSRLIA